MLLCLTVFLLAKFRDGTTPHSQNLKVSSVINWCVLQ